MSIQHVTTRLETNPSIVENVFTKYANTFKAFCELINNAIQAKAKTIKIDIEYNNGLESNPIEKITIEDDGVGVHQSDFKKKILNLGTQVKENGLGIGRFGALQIGNKMRIETVGFNKEQNTYSYIDFELLGEKLRGEDNLSNIEIGYNIEDNINTQETYYKVEISELYHGNINCEKKNKLHSSFLNNSIDNSIFENYVLSIFNDEVQFYINGKFLDKENYILDNQIIENSYINTKDEENDFKFHFFKLSLKKNGIKVFLMLNNADVLSVGASYEIESDWHTIDLGAWFVYIESKLFESDLFRNIDMDALGNKEIEGVKKHILDSVEHFFRRENSDFNYFISKLESDPVYRRLPERKSNSQEIVFKKAAYLVEREYSLLKKDEKIRNMVYPLINRSISHGEIDKVFEDIINLSDDNLEKFKTLLERTDIENVIEFASSVAEKVEFIEFLAKIVYGKTSQHIKERSQLHKIIEKHLWIFGEAYDNQSPLYSDKQIRKIIEDLVEKKLIYSANKEDGNLIEDEDLSNIEGINNITDLYFFSQKTIDENLKEILVVELKAPNCSISKKELGQIEDYAYTLEQLPELPSGYKYKLILVSSKLTGFAKSKMKANKNSYESPFLYERKQDKKIETYVMEWSEIIDMNRRKLTYLQKELSIKDKDVAQKFDEEYPEIVDSKLASHFKKIKSS